MRAKAMWFVDQQLKKGVVSTKFDDLYKALDYRDAVHGTLRKPAETNKPFADQLRQALEAIS